MARQIIIAISADDEGRVALTTNLPRPVPGRGLNTEDAAALELLRMAQHLPNLETTTYDANHLAPDVSEAFDLIRELINPDGFGYSVTAEVGNAARRVLQIKGQQVGLSQ